MVQAGSFIQDKRIGLLRGARMQFSIWFYAMHMLFWLKRALEATIHKVTFESLVKNA